MATDQERNEIQSHLFAYGDSCDFVPLCARDYGSRARNLASDQSDYDVMFVFAQRPAEYAVGRDTDRYTKTIPASENNLDTEIELHGWSLKSFIGNDGLAGSNPTAIEFCLSDEEYLSPGMLSDPWDRLIEHAAASYKPYALIQHYRSLAASNYGKYIEGDYTLADGTTWDDLLWAADPDWKNLAHDATNGLAVDEAQTEITSDHVAVYGQFEQTPYLGRIDIADAIADGLVRETTTDRTIKRHLNVMQALCKARFIEHTKQNPPLNAIKLIRSVTKYDWFPNQVRQEMAELIMQKKAGNGDELIEDDTRLHDWIESELDRTVDPEGYVEQQPDSELLSEQGKTIYHELMSVWV